MRDLRGPGMLMYPLRSWLGITPKPRLGYPLPQRLTTKVTPTTLNTSRAKPGFSIYGVGFPRHVDSAVSTAANLLTNRWFESSSSSGESSELGVALTRMATSKDAFTGESPTGVWKP